MTTWETRLPLPRTNSATVICNVEIANYLAAKGINTHGMQMGGGFNFPFGRVIDDHRPPWILCDGRE
jgi:hypothetical protein